MTTNNKFKPLVFAAAGMAALVACAETTERAPSAAVRVMRNGREAFVRRAFNATEDIVIHVCRGANEHAYILPKAAATADVKTKGMMFHDGGDDWVASTLGGFGWLGGNHGTAFTALQTVKGHGFTAADIGAIVRNTGAGDHVLVGVPDADRLLVHPLGSKGPNPFWHTNDGGTFSCNGHTWKPEKTERRQLYPMTIYTKFAWSGPDGCAIPEGREIALDYLDLTVENSVVDPRAMLAYLRDHKGALGRMPTFKPAWDILFADTPEAAARVADYMTLPRLMSLKTRYRYTPDCARLIDRAVTYHSEIANVRELGLCYGWNGREDEYGTWEFYIPGLKKMTLKGAGGPDIPNCDFTGVMKMARYPTFKASHTISPNDMVDPTLSPNRFIRLARRDGARRLGVVVGYSPINGLTARANKSKYREHPYFFFPGGKFYPIAYEQRLVKPGDTFVLSAYTQFFDPTIDADATAFYHHRDGDADVVWLDFHKPVRGKRIPLPAGMTGRRVSVVEKSPSVTLHTAGRLPADGLLLDVTGNYGELVVRLDP